MNRILLENKLPNKEFSFEDLNGNDVIAMIGIPVSRIKNVVTVGYQVNGNQKHENNKNIPDTKNLFYILGRITKFVENYIKQFSPTNIIIQSDFETGNIAEKRINIYKGLVDKIISKYDYSSRIQKNKNGYYILITNEDYQD